MTSDVFSNHKDSVIPHMQCRKAQFGQEHFPGYKYYLLQQAANELSLTSQPLVVPVRSVSLGRAVSPPHGWLWLHLLAESSVHPWVATEQSVCFCFPCRKVRAFPIHRRGSEAGHGAAAHLVLAPRPVLLPGCDKNLSSGRAPPVPV